MLCHVITDYRQRFKSCGEGVVIEEGVEIEHPEVMEVGDRVYFFRGFRMIDRPEIVRIGSDVTFYPNCFIQGAAERFDVADHVDFFPNSYISLGKGPGTFVSIGHHTHFAPGCCLYGHGGLTIGPYCNIAAHCVLATVGHDPVIRDQPMALVPGCSGPITLVEDVWLGANVTVTSNVTIAKGCIIGANAVVNKNTEAFGLYVGVPARKVRDRKKS
jgi:acetyltransferase-like isoleucine patch superfamily enzyme